MAIQLIHKFECLCCGGVYQVQQPDGSVYHHTCPPLAPDQNGVVMERENKRDENIQTVRGDRVTGIKAEGMGVKCLTSDKLQEPPWLTALYARIERDAG